MEDASPELEEDQPRGRVTLTAVIRRKDGTIEDRGVIAEGWVEGWHASSDPS